LPSGALCSNSYFLIPTFGLPFTSVIVSRIELPAFQNISTVSGTLSLSPAIRLAYRTDEQFVTGLRTILGDSEEIQEGDIVAVSGTCRVWRPRCPLDNTSADDILHQFGWMIACFHIRHPEHLLKTDKLLLMDVSIDMSQDFQQALQSYRGSMALYRGIPVAFWRALTQPNVHLDTLVIEPKHTRREYAT